MFSAPVTDPAVTEVLAAATNGVAAGQMDTRIFRDWLKTADVQMCPINLQVRSFASASPAESRAGEE